MVIPDVVLLTRDWTYLAGVMLALTVGVVLRKESTMMLVVLALTFGMTTAAQPAAPYLAMLLVLPAKVWTFIRPA